MKSVTTKFAFASIYILFTVLLISMLFPEQAKCQQYDPCRPEPNTPECPCIYDTVPANSSCWGECKNCTGDPVFQPCTVPGCNEIGDSCALYRINFFNGFPLIGEYMAGMLTQLFSDDHHRRF